VKSAGGYKRTYIYIAYIIGLALQQFVYIDIGEQLKPAMLFIIVVIICLACRQQRRFVSSLSLLTVVGPVGFQFAVFRTT